jgi:asparagine synthase (glutamine-hydrolysing)
MPGLVGFISSQGASFDSSRLEEMKRTMLHEPGYTSGSLIEPRFGLSVAWINHGGSFSDCLPIWNASKDICLIFVGEHYADSAAVEDENKRKGSSAGRDATYLLKLYEEDDSGFFEKLNGTFAGLVVDVRRNKVMLFNDRFGLGRVYYHQNSDGFFFASEAKAILKVVSSLRALDPQGLAEFFACGSVLQNRTLYKDIFILPPSSSWKINGPTVQKAAYFDKAQWEEQSALSTEDYYEKLRSAFSRVLPRYFKESERIAMSITGGLDSRIIMAWDRHDPATLPCYSHRGMYRECADSYVGRRVATACKQPHRTITIDESFFPQFPKLAEEAVYLTDGLIDASGAAGLYVNRVARNEIAPIRMTGNYGGEILRSLVILSPGDLKEGFLSRDLLPQVRAAADVLAAERKGNRLSFIAFKQVPWHHYTRYALEQSQLTVRSPYLDNDLVELAYLAPSSMSRNQEIAARLIRDGNPALLDFPTDRGPLGRNGVLGRLSENFQEFTFKAEYAYDFGMPQWLAKIDNALSVFHFERLFLGRHKYNHFRPWYRRQLAGYVKDVLLDPRSLQRSYLNPQTVKEMVLAHVSGKGNFTSEIHTLLGMELLHRRLLEGL